MTNIFKNPAKRNIKKRLLEIALQTLRSEGWEVERTAGGASVRLIRKGNTSHRVSVRTTQDQWIAFPRRANDKGWVTLSDVDVVVVASVDDADNPQAARVHWLNADKLLARFDRAYKTRKEAGHTIPLARGIWIPLYIAEDGNPRYAGGGAGLDAPEIARVPLAVTNTRGESQMPAQAALAWPRGNGTEDYDKPLTIAEAKRRLALTFGVPETSIKISVEA
jgi:hypothetical protein